MQPIVEQAIHGHSLTTWDWPHTIIQSTNSRRLQTEGKSPATMLARAVLLVGNAQDHPITDTPHRQPRIGRADFHQVDDIA